MQVGSPVWKGASLTVAAYFLVTVNDLLIKILIEEIPTGQLLVVRSVFGCGFLLVLTRIARRSQRLWPKRMGRVVVCAGLVVPVIYLFPFSLNYLPLTTALILSFSSPIIVVLLAPFVTGEKPGKRRITAVLVGFIGTVLIVNPEGGGWHLAYVLPIICAFILAARDLVTRKIGLDENPISISLFAFFIVSATAPLTAITGAPWVQLNISQIALLGAAGACLAFGQTIAIVAFRYASTPVISTLKFTSIVWSAVFSLVLFNHWPTPLELVGAGLIALSSIAIVIIRDERISSAQTPILTRRATKRSRRTEKDNRA